MKIRCESDGSLTPELESELKDLAAMSDDDIDLSDIPEVTDWSGAVRGKYFDSTLVAKAKG